MGKFKVTFKSDNKSVMIEKDRTILSAAIYAGISVNAPCGGDGVCGRCKVRIIKGNVFSQPTGLVSDADRSNGISLACGTSVLSDVEVEVLAESRLDSLKMPRAEEIEFQEPRIKEFSLDPLTKKIFLVLPQPTLHDNISDLDRIMREIKKSLDISGIQVALANVRSLSRILRDADWNITVTLGRRNNGMEIILIEPGDTSKKNYGFAVDIGTTTISCQLIDLVAGKILGVKAVYNRQAVYGADVISRIIYSEKGEGLEILHQAVTGCINEIIEDLVLEHKIDLNDVTGVVCAGNTTMIHLLLRVDPSFIRREPYVPAVNSPGIMRALEAGIKINPHGLLSCGAGISSYVGADVSAGAFATGLDKAEELSLLIDIGTNGEIVLGNKDFLIAASASAGPAFEGSGVSSGMRSSSGAIQKVRINSGYEVEFETISGAKPRGICGSGYIDIIAQMLKTGLLDKNGKIKNVESKRVRKTEFGEEFVLVFEKDCACRKDIVITEADIENIKRSKAAIYAACNILVRHMSLDFGNVRKIFIAGGFGTSLNIESAIRIGLLPNLDLERFVFVGNTSLSGARQMLLSGEADRTASAIAAKMSYFELSVEHAYMDEYMAALFFPHTDLARFGSIK
ncbi:MAG: ASKHA domain-containing protein [Candidatus Omnitrophota bacterium]